MKGITEAISLENLENIVQRTLQKPLFPTQVRVMQRCKKRPIDKIHFSLQNYEKLEMSLVFQSSLHHLELAAALGVKKQVNNLLTMGYS